MYYFCVCLEELRKNHENAVKLADVPADNRIEQSTSVSLERCCYSNPLDTIVVINPKFVVLKLRISNRPVRILLYWKLNAEQSTELYSY
jgi:hypothetical protein